MPGFKKMLPMSRAMRQGGAGTVKPQPPSGGLDLGASKGFPSAKAPKAPKPPSAPKAPKFFSKGGGSKR